MSGSSPSATAAIPTSSWPAEAGAEGAGRRLLDFMAELAPLRRSLTGDGVRETLARIARRIPLVQHEVPSGTPVLDWTVPDEWNVRDAYVATADGTRVIDVRRSPLHLVGYSVPVRARLSLAELREHLFTLPERPDWIPFRTSYYRKTWGFCLSHRQLESLPATDYEVCIDASLEPGALTYGECYLPGTGTDEVLVSAHVCHPAMANDNLSGLAVATFLAAELAARPARRYGYRFLFAPGTLGAIAWLARNEERLGHVRHGLVLACLGDGGRLTYKQSRRTTAEIDRVVAHVLATTGRPHRIVPFSPYGYDERQFCSPGFDLPVGCLTRTPYGQFPEYHTSADDLDFVRPEALADSLAVLRAVVTVLEDNRVYLNTSPRGEPQLGRRGLYRSVGGLDASAEEHALLWVLNLGDGRHSLLDIAERAGLSFVAVARAAAALRDRGLLVEAPRA